MKQTPFLEQHHYELAERSDLFGRQSGGDHDHQLADEETREIARALGREGFLDHVVRAKYGGRSNDLDVRSICVLREQLSYYSSLADLMFAMQGLGSYPLSLAGSETLKSRFLPLVRSGEAVAAFAVTEPNAGSDISSIETTARRDSGGHVLDGEKTFISNAGLADFYTVFARTGQGKDNKSLSAFVVEKDRPGFCVKERIEMIAPHPIGRIAFDGCKVPKENMLGKEGDGLKIALSTLDTFRPTVGAAAVGLARRGLDEAVSRAKSRVQFGKPIAEFQATQLKLAEMATEIEAARLLVLRAAWMRDSGAERITLVSSMAKWFATESAQRVIDSAVQIHGGAGLVRGAVVERLYREVRALRIYEGTSEIQQLIIARHLLATDSSPGS